MEKNENKEIGFLLKGIKTEQFATFEENFNANKHNIELLTSFEIKISSQNKQVGVFAGFEFKQDAKHVIKLVVSCHFGIIESAWQEYSSADSISFPKEFIAHLAMITVGTSRGVLFAKTEGTPLSKLILPTIDVASRLKEQITFSLNT